jgi:hypothetical protein
MAPLTIELSAKLYDRLCREAERQGKSPQQLAEELLTECLVRLELELADELEHS